MSSFEEKKQLMNDTDVKYIQFVCNACFPDSFVKNENQKFPGAMVASLSRTEVQYMRGYDMVYKPYKLTEIIEWIKPQKHLLPPCFRRPKQFGLPRIVKTVAKIDYGPSDSKLFCIPNYFTTE